MDCSSFAAYGLTSHHFSTLNRNHFAAYAILCDVLNSGGIAMMAQKKQAEKQKLWYKKKKKKSMNDANENRKIQSKIASAFSFNFIILHVI